MTTKKLTLDDLYRELGQLISEDMSGQQTEQATRQKAEQKAMSERHELERTAMKAKAHRHERRRIELAEAIRLTKEGIDPMQAVMQCKGQAWEVPIGSGPDSLWVMPPREEDDGA